MNTNNLAQQAQENAQLITQQNSALLEGCCLMGSNIRSCSGERTLPNATIEIDGEKISSSCVKGSKIQWFPRKKLSITTKYTARISRLMMSVGVKFGDMTVVPKSKLADLQPQLEEIYKEWTTDVNDLVVNFDDIMEEHVKENASIAGLIRKFALDKHVFQQSFKLTYLPPLAIQPLCEDDIGEIEAAVAMTMWEEIAKEALNLYKASWFKDKAPVHRVSQAIRNPLKRLKEKLLSLSFLDEGVINVTRSFDDLFNNLPRSGYIEGHEFLQLTNFVHVLSDQVKLKMHAEGMSQFSYKALSAQQTSITSNNVSNSVKKTASPIERNKVKGTPVVQKPLTKKSQLGFGLNF